MLFAMQAETDGYLFNRVIQGGMIEMRIKKMGFLLVSLMFLLLFLPANSFCVTITDSVQNPGTAIGTLTNIDDSFTYGDFTIKYAGDLNSFGSPEDRAAGDGLDESWDWSFDYAGQYVTRRDFL